MRTLYVLLSSWHVRLFATLCLFLFSFSIRGKSFEICNDGCTAIPLGFKVLLVAARKSISLFKENTVSVSLDTSWLTPFSLRFVIRNGILIVFPGLTLSLFLAAFLICLQHSRAYPKPRMLNTIIRFLLALLLIIVAHSDFHSFLLDSEYQGYNTHGVKRRDALPPQWFRDTFNCTTDSFPSFGEFNLVSSGDKPCLIYKFSGSVGLENTDCDLVQIQDGADRSFSPYGPFWKRAVFLQEAARGQCLEKGKYEQLFYADNDNIIDYYFQPNLTAPYYSVRYPASYGWTFGTGLNAVTVKRGNSKKILAFTTEWLSFYNHPNVVGEGIHDLAPFRRNLGKLNLFPQALNGAVKLKTRHCARHTINRNRCVLGFPKIPNLELQIINDAVAVQTMVSLISAVAPWLLKALVGATVGMNGSLMGGIMYALKLVAFGIFLGLEVGGSFSEPSDGRLKLSKFRIWHEREKFTIDYTGFAINSKMTSVVTGNVLNGFSSSLQSVYGWMAFVVGVCILTFCVAKVLGTSHMWCFNISYATKHNEGRQNVERQRVEL